MVAGLAAAGGIEDRPVEQHAAARIDADDGRLARLEVGIFAKQGFGHQASGSKGISMSGARSSQAGTGRPFSRRKEGSNSRDW